MFGVFSIPRDMALRYRSREDIPERLAIDIGLLTEPEIWTQKTKEAFPFCLLFSNLRNERLPAYGGRATAPTCRSP
jgi:hypothetical protein